MSLLNIFILVGLLNYSHEETIPIEVSTIPLNFNSFVSGIICYHSGRSENLIVTDEHAVWIVNIKIDPPAKHLIAGSSTSGYKEGTGSEARFSYPRDIAILYDGRILVADQANDCLRAIDLQTNSTSTYAGLCKSEGFSDGHRLNARFYNPIGIRRLGKKIYICDWLNSAIRIVQYKSDYVTTLYRGSPLFYPAHITGWNDGFLYVTVIGDGIARIELLNDGVNLALMIDSSPSGSANEVQPSSYSNLIGIIHLDEHTLAVGSEHYQLRVLDLKNNGMTSICSVHSVDGNRDTCSFDTPRGVNIYNDMMMFGVRNRIRSLPVDSIIAKPEKEVEFIILETETEPELTTEATESTIHADTIPRGKTRYDIYLFVSVVIGFMVVWLSMLCAVRSPNRVNPANDTERTRARHTPTENRERIRGQRS